MSTLKGEVRDLITQQAAEWFVANRDVQSAKERQAFFDWLRTSPVHVEEYLAYSAMTRDLQRASEYSDDALAQLLASARNDSDPIVSSLHGGLAAGLPRNVAQRWHPVAVISAACAMAGVGWVALEFVWPARLEAPPAAVVETRLSTVHGQIKSIQLADNSILHLNTESDVTLRYSSQERLAIIHAGEADFEIVHETDRPFRVVSGSTEIVDHGTKFDVLRAPGSTVVTVLEGSVAVSHAAAKIREQVMVNADQQVTVADSAWPPARVLLVDAQQTTAWLHRQITFNRAPLEKVAAEFNRYALKPIEIVSPALKTFEISGVFSTDDAAAFMAFLRSLDGVRVEETATQIRVFGKAR